MGFSGRIRRKVYQSVFGEGVKPQEGEMHEYAMNSLACFCNFCFVIGSVCFASSSNTVAATGDWLYILACVINTYLSGRSFIHHVIELADEDDSNDPDDNEVNEEAMFFLSSAVFTFGCICFMPGLPAPLAAFFNDGLGAWLCIAGSFMLVAAAYWNGLGLANVKVGKSVASRLTFKLNKIILACTLAGAVLFTVGSFMYRPSFGGQCPKQSSNTICISISSYGTTLYLAGSIVFLVSSLLLFPITILKFHGGSAAGESTPLQKSTP